MPLWDGRIGLARVRSDQLRRGIRQMRASHKVSAVFDDPNLIGSAGLVPVMRLAHRAGLQDLLEQRLSVPSANAAAKAACVMAGVLAGADSIDDLDVLRHGGMGRVFTDVRAPSTLGTFLRSFTFGHVRELDAVHTRVLAGLATVVPRLLAGVDGLAFIDIDDTIREVHGYAKQGRGTGTRGEGGQRADRGAVLADVRPGHRGVPAAEGQRRLRARSRPDRHRRHRDRPCRRGLRAGDGAGRLRVLPPRPHRRRGHR